MIGEKELRVLGSLKMKKKRQELADDLEYAAGTITNALNRLEELALIRRQSMGSETVVFPADNRCVETYQSLSQSHPHVDFPGLLTNSMLRLLYHLDAEEPVTARDLIRDSELPKATVFRNLDRLTNRAIVMKENSHYRLSDEFKSLGEFANELRHQHHRVRIQNDVGSGVLLWESFDEFLLQTDEIVERDDYFTTGVDALSAWNLQFYGTSRNCYLYTTKRESLSPADVACHLLLIENDDRHRKYALLLVATTAIPHDEVRAVARDYDVSNTMDPLLELLENRGEANSDTAPSWDALQSLAREYGVDL